MPIFTGIIKNSKEKTRQDSVALYGRAIENAIAEYFVKYPLENEVDYSTLESEKLINFKGKGQIKCEVTYIIDRSVYLDKCTVNGKSVEATYGKSFGVLVQENDNDNGSGGTNNTSSGAISVGDKYLYRVNKEVSFNFYVLSVNNDDTVNLIMDRNICEDGTTNYTKENNYCRYSWYANALDNRYGPVDAMKAIYNATKEWTYVPTMAFTYSDIDDNRDSGATGTTYGYTGITPVEGNPGIVKIKGKDASNETTIGTSEKPLKARLPKLKEVTDNGCDLFIANEDAHSGSCAWWIVDNLAKYFGNYYDNTNIKYLNDSTPATYWLLSSFPGRTDARAIFKNGHEIAVGTKMDLTLDEDGVPINKGAGIRPVITVPKTYLSK